MLSTNCGEVKTMSTRFALMLALNFVIFGFGGLARLYMNHQIRQMLLPNGSRIRFTERSYIQLIKEKRAQTWPLIMAAICIPLGVIIAFAAVIWSNHVGNR
jgi:hypothetical protein